MAELYNARLRGTEAGAPAPGFAVVLAEDAAYRAADKRMKDGDYWRELFADRPEVASLAPGNPVSAPGFHRRAVEIDTAAFARLKAMGERTNIPWPDVVTALSAAYVQRHTGTPEVILGVPFMARLGSAAARVPRHADERAAAAGGGPEGRSRMTGSVRWRRASRAPAGTGATVPSSCAATSS